MEDNSAQNPRETAGFLSLLTVSWMNKVLKLGSKHPLEEKHLFPLETSFQAEKLVNDLEKEWLAEERVSEQNKTKPRLWRAMMRVISNRDYITLALLRICYSITMNLLPLMLWFFLKSISSGSKINYTRTLLFVLCISVVSFARCVFINHGTFKADMLAVRLKVAVVGLVYKKILTLNRCILQHAISENTINIVSNDAQVIELSGYYANGFSFVALDLLISFALVWYLVAWQALIGVCFFFFVSVYGSLAALKSGMVRGKAAAQTDKRLEIMNEIVAGIRVVKMYAWEWKFRDLVAQIRRNEISLIRIRGFIISSIYALFFTSHTIAGFISVTTLVLTDHSLTSFKVFTLLSVLANIKFFVTIFIGDCLRYLADARTACNRMQRLIESKSVLTSKKHQQNNVFPLEVYFKGRRYNPQFIRTESFRPGKPALMSVRKLEQTSQYIEPHAILANVSSFWNFLSDRPAVYNISMSAKNGQLVGITGAVGSGKTSLLMSILGELPISSGQISCIGKTAYVSQTPWVYSATVRQNIVFGMPFVEEKYNKIVEVCDLEKDLSSFPKRDLTEIGQRGVILSGGQRARVSLARAIYSDADIYLLDDPLSAVDAKVGKHLFDRCINEFLAGRVRILVTHQLQFFQHADNIVILEDGSVVYQGTYSQMETEELRRNFSILTQEPNTNDIVTVIGEEEAIKTANAVDKHRARVDLKEEEEDRMVGTVRWWLYWKYFRAALPVVLIVMLAVFLAVVPGTVINF